VLHTWILQTRQRTWAIFSVFVVLLLLVALGIVQQRLQHDLAAKQLEAQREINSLGSLVAEALRRGQYQNLETLLRDWGDSNSELTKLQVIGQNGFILSTYQRNKVPDKALKLTLPIEYSYRGHATLNLTLDLAAVYEGIASLRKQFVFILLMLSSLLGVVLLQLLKRQDEAAILRSRTLELDSANTLLRTENSHRRAAEEALFQAKERAEVTLYSIGDAVITTDAQGFVDYLNPIAEKLTGWAAVEAAGKALTDVFPIFNETTHEAVENPVARCLREGIIVGLANHTVLKARDGREVAIEDSAAPIRARNGEITGVVMVFHDVTKSREMAQKLSWQAAHDALTGLINRREFESRLQQALDASHTEAQQHALIYLDLDQFKIVNDTCGHVAGDELLRQLSALLQLKMRASDTLARLGGDEFGVLLAHCPLDQAKRIAEVLRVATRDFRFIWEQKTFEISASMGVVLIDRTSGTLPQVLSAADIACYMSKERGRNRIHVYQESDADFARRHGEMLWVTRLNQALRDHHFVLYRQEIRAISASKPGRFYEVLLRIRNEDGSLSLPGSFLPAAERYDLMCAIDRWVIEHLFEAENASLGIHAILMDDNALTLATINLSGASLNDETFLDFVRSAIQKYHINPQRICFEITETVAITHFDRAIRLVTALREIGCRFALDDFGSGLSSFGYLKNLPMDFLKIDGGLVRHIVDNPIDSAMVEAINDIGHVMGLKTIAEYVENDAIRDKLRHIGVDYIQGFGIHIPQPFPLDGHHIEIGTYEN